MTMQTLARGLVVVALLAAPRVAASQPIEPGPTDVTRARLLRADAYDARDTASQLGFLEGAHLAFKRTTELHDGSGSHGAFAAFGIADALGVGLSWEQLPLGRTGGQFSSSFALAAGTASLGYALRAVRDRDSGDSVERLHDVDLTVRIGEHMAIGAGVSNIAGRDTVVSDSPLLRTTIAARSWAGRFGFETSVETPPDAAERATISPVVNFRVIDGLVISGGAQFAPRGDDLLVAAGAGLELAFEPLIVSATAESRPAQGSWATSTSVEFRGPFEPQLHTDEGALVRIDLHGRLSERPGYQLFEDPTPAFTDRLVALRRIAEGSSVSGVYLHIASIDAGYARLTELRSLLTEIRATGKLVVAYVASGGLRDLYVASAADHIVIAPSATIVDASIGVSALYFGDLLDLLGVDAQFVRVGRFKSATERFTESGPSDPSREQIAAYIDAVYHVARTAIADGRGLSSEALERALESAPLPAGSLRDAQLVDAVLYEDELRDHLRETYGRRFRVIRQTTQERERSTRWGVGDRIAVIHIAGNIVSGRGGGGLLSMVDSTGAARIESVAEEIARDPRIAGVIVRISSPGGSASASDEIHRALTRLAREKPTVVSLGDVAASGGYYAAAIGSTVYATQPTLTGSIGIFAGTFSVDRLIGRLGIGRFADSRGGPHDLFAGRSWSEEERGQVQTMIEELYALFVERVAEGRDMTVEEVDAVGQGRIFSGAEAASASLVDDLGGFSAALTHVRREAGIDPRLPTMLVHYPEPTPFDALGSTLSVALSGVGGGDRSPRRIRLSDILPPSLAPFAELVASVAGEPPATPLALFPFAISGID